jgi:RHS repeat-associated protein
MKTSSIRPTLICTLAALALLARPTRAQSSVNFHSTDGYTPPTMAPGSPEGSYQLSGLDTIHPGTRHLNFRLVLYTMRARGDVSLPIVLRPTRIWRAFSIPHEYTTNPLVLKYTYLAEDAWWTNLATDYSPGYLMARPATSGSDGLGNALYTNLQLTFMGPDGTELELRDAATLGSYRGDTAGTDRGSVFVSVDGSAATFMSHNANQQAVNLPDDTAPGREAYPVSGTMFTRDGTRYRIDDGLITRITDRNGNYFTIAYDVKRPVTITDSLGRTLTFVYDTVVVPDDPDPEKLETVDTITYKDSGGTDRNILVYYRKLNNGLLRPDFAAPMSRTDLFPTLTCNAWGFDSCDSTPYDPVLPWKVVYPNDDTYLFWYNPCGEVARVRLPTGGGYDYDYETQVDETGSTCTDTPCRVTLTRKATAKKTYTAISEAGTATGLVAETKFSEAQLVMPSRSCPGTGQLYGYPVVTRDGANHVLRASSHYYLRDTPLSSDPTIYPSWQEQRECRTERFDSDLTTTLQAIVNTWQQRPRTEDGFTPNNPNEWYAPLHDPRIARTDTTNEQSEVASTTFVYDQYNNATETTEYDWNASQLRDTLRTYLTAGYDTVGTTPDATTHLRSLVSSETVWGEASALASFTQYYYDGATETSSTLVAPTANTGAVGRDPRYESGLAMRGNLTRIWHLQSGSNYVAENRNYDVNGNLVTSTDAKGNVATFEYADTPGWPVTAYAFPTTIKLPSARDNQPQMAETYEYNYYLGKPTKHTDANGQATQYAYSDTLGRLTKVTAPGDGATTVYTYDDGANPSVTTCQDSVGAGGCPTNGIKDTVVYDGLGRAVQTQQTAANGAIYVDTVYDGLNRKVEVSNPGFSSGGAHTTYTYDLLDRTTSVCTADNACTGTVYQGSISTVSDPAGASRQLQTDALGRLVHVVEDPGVLGYASTYRYNGLGNLTRVCQNGTYNPSNDTCTGGQLRKFEYDNLGRLLSANNPESGLTRYGYDANGNMTRRVMADNSTTNIQYDALNRPYWKQYSDARSGVTAAVTTCYDGYVFSGAQGQCIAGSATYPKMRVTNVHTSESDTKYGYDERGRVTDYRQTTGNQSPYVFSNFEYNLFGGLTAVTYPSGREVKQAFTDRQVTAIGYSNAGLDGSYATSIQYAPQGAVSQISFANGVTETWQFNSARQQPTCITAAKSGPALLSLTLSYTTQNIGCDASGSDNNGNLLSQAISGTGGSFTQTYSYDKVNRLTDAHETDRWHQHYVYDPFGNRALVSGAGYYIPGGDWTPRVNADDPSQVTAQFAGNRWTSANAQYDGGTPSVGNVTVLPGFVFTYDAESRLKTSTHGGVTTTYTYDGNGRRVMKQAGSANPTIYVYDATGNLAAEYGASAPAPCATCYLTADHLGSTRLLTNEDGAIAGLHDYLPFGEEIPSGDWNRTAQDDNGTPLYGSDQPNQKFTGKERDGETGLDYFGARYFSGAQGRFTSPDKPFADQYPEDPQSWNLYGYVRNNPLAYVDPTGEGQAAALTAQLWQIGATTPIPWAKLALGAAVITGATAYIVDSDFRRDVNSTVNEFVTTGPMNHPMHPVAMAEDEAVKGQMQSNARPGTLGKPDHQQTVKEEGQRVNGKTEAPIPTPGGKKEGRRADATGTNPQTGAPEIVQVYRPTPAGNIPKRERDAAADIENATGVKPTMVPVRPLPPPKPPCTPTAGGACQ